MPRRVAEVVAISALAVIVSLVMAAAVLRAPSERVFGMEVVGRHHDPFTVMQQFERPLSLGMFSQPVTDVTGALLARMSNPVAAYNWLVLLSFPLSAAAAYLLARYLALSPAGAVLAAMAYAFSPFHVAHAAYHPHVAQTQWIPLYLLALWRCLDHASPAALSLLGAAALAVTLSNFYGGLIAAVITPVAVAAYWIVKSRATTPSTRALGLTAGGLALICACGAAYGWYAANAVVVNREAFAFPRDDLFVYSAKWWSYLVPPVEHPLLGAAIHRLWSSAGVREGLLEQQVSLGLGIVTLGLIAVVRWAARGRQPAALTYVPVLVIVAMAALVCSLSPERTIGSLTFTRPSALLYDVVPMFRSYARFGVVVQLMAVLLAGIGVDYLRRTGSTAARIVAVALVALVAAEYAVAPWQLWRDVLPTAAHRWLTQQPDHIRALDCMPLTPVSESVPWLTRGRVTMASSTSDCTEPNLSQKLAAQGYTHLLVRRQTSDGRWFAENGAKDGLRVAAHGDEGQVFAVMTPSPVVYTATTTGFSPREHDAQSSWQWMGPDAAWTVVNTGTRPIVAILNLEIAAFHRARGLDVRLDGRTVQALVVGVSSEVYALGPLTIAPGDHQLVFHPDDLPTVADDVMHNGDRRPLSFALGTWNWTVQGEQP